MDCSISNERHRRAISSRLGHAGPVPNSPSESAHVVQHITAPCLKSITFSHGVSPLVFVVSPYNLLRIVSLRKVEVVEGILDTFIVEAFVPHGQSDEHYVCINSNREGEEFLFCHDGGVDVGDVDAKAERLQVGQQLRSYNKSTKFVTCGLGLCVITASTYNVDARLPLAFFKCRFSHAHEIRYKSP